MKAYPIVVLLRIVAKFAATALLGVPHIEDGITACIDRPMLRHFSRDCTFKLKVLFVPVRLNYVVLTED